LHDDVRISKDVFSHVTGEQAGRPVVAAAGTEADDDLDRFAFVKGFLSQDRFKG